MTKEPRFPNKLLITGMVLVLIGSAALFWTLSLFHEVMLWLVSLWPVVLVVAGLVMLYLVYLKEKSDRLILPGMILFMSGIFFLLYNTIIPEKSIERIWPAFMDIAGISLLPYAFKKRRRTRIGLFISALTLIGMSLLFFPFSLNLIETDFLHFAIQWWPVIIIGVGLVLIVSYLINRRRRRRTTTTAQDTTGPDDRSRS
ncbi:MAG TPA: hypothetical protein ENN69_09035 [Spirochaetia bacterium]|nr:hypothetical protein [Spirochaetia bacterium]